MEPTSMHELTEHDTRLRNLAAFDVRLQSYTPQYTFLLGYVLTNTFLFFYSAVPEYKSWSHHQYRPWIAAIARGCGYIFNFNIALQMFLGCRTSLTFMRKTSLSLLIPFDYAMPEMHSIVGITSFLAVLLHAIFHAIVGFGVPLWASGFGEWTHLFVSGVFLLLIYSVIEFTSLPSIRNANYEVFYTTHLVGTFLSLCLLVLHGLHKGKLYSYKWILGSVLLYVLDKSFVMATVKTASVKVKVGSNSRILIYEGGIVRLSFKKPFEYRAGQYAQLCIPKISKTQWHPFTFASAPHEDSVLFFIKREGSWTVSLHNMCKYHLERKRRRNIFKFEVRIRGPYGAPAEHAAQYDRVLLISGGVGATPFCSITKQITYDYLKRTGEGGNMIIPERRSNSETSRADQINAFVNNQWSELLDAGRTAFPTLFQKTERSSTQRGTSRSAQLKNPKNERHRSDLMNETESGTRDRAQLLYTITNSCAFNTTMLWILMLRLFVNMMSIAFEYSDMSGKGVVILESTGIQVTDLVLGLAFVGGLCTAISSEIASEKRISIMEVVISLPLACVPVILGILTWSRVQVGNGKLTWIYFVIIWPMTIVVFLLRYFRALGERALLSGRVKKAGELCSSVDFIWTTKKREEDVWLLEELKRSIGRTRFVRLHRFITGEKGGRMEGEGIVRAHYGRPNWNDIFNKVVWNVRNGGTVGIFFCGPVEMAGAVKEAATCSMFDSRYRGMRNEEGGLERDRTIVDSVKKAQARSFNVRFVFRRERY